MIEEKREALSAMLDDELPGRVFDQLITDLGQDRDLRDAMSRYRLIGDVLRGDGSAAASGDVVAAAVRERLANEPAILATQRVRAAANWGRGLAGIAIAASVALVAVGVFSERRGTPLTLDEQAAVAEAGPQNANDLYGHAAPPARAPDAPSTGEIADRRLTRYLAEHNEFASRGAANGFMSYTTFVAYDSR